MNRYQNLSRAKITCDFLHSNSTTHEFLFGALAELVDNSRDADSTSLEIFTTIDSNFRGDYILHFRDDGCGMDPFEASDVIQFGSSNKRALDKNLIGQYGNGLKSGSMRIGNDLLLLTKKNDLLTILFMSETFLKLEKINEVIVPLPSFDNKTKKPWLNQNYEPKSAIEKHNLEMEVIFKYTPFKNLNQIFEQFDKIGSHGTLAMIFNLKLTDRAETELDFEMDKEDILMRDLRVDYDRKTQLEHKSFRAYVTILYSNPRMKIYIQNKKVHTKLMERSLYLPAVYSYTSNKFKHRAIQEKNNAEDELRKAKNELREAESNLANAIKNRLSNSIELTKIKREKEKAEENFKLKKSLLEKRTKEVNSPRELNFIFGINIHNRDADGLFIYNCNRLIIMFEHTKNQKKNQELRGIVGIVNVPYMISKPTHNKQQFADSTEQRQLISALSDYMDNYSINLGKDLNSEFWKEFGYFSPRVDLPTDDEVYLKRRLLYSKICVQCTKCLKWRMLRWHPKLMNKAYYTDDWTCNENTDTNKQQCFEPESLEEFMKYEYKKVQETDFYEIEEKLNPNPPKVMESSKSYAALVQKERNETIEKSVPPPILTKTSSQQKLTNNSQSYGSNRQSRLTSLNDSGSDTDTASNGRSFSSKRKRVVESDDENDPTFSITNQNNRKYVNRSQTKEKNQKSRQPDNSPSEENNNELNINEIQSNGVTIKNEPDIAVSDHVIPFAAHDDNNFDNGCNRSDSLATDPRIRENIAKKYKELLMLVAQTSNETQPLRDVIKTFDDNQLVEFSVNDFFNKFRDGLVRAARKQVHKSKTKVVSQIKESIRENIIEKYSVPEEAFDKLFSQFEKPS